MSDDDLDRLLKPLSAKVQPKHRSWGNISMGTDGDKQSEDQKATRSIQSKLWHMRRKASKKSP